MNINMGALKYEYLLRRIYQVGRGGRKGADADVYRELERAERLYTLEVENVKNNRPKTWNKSNDELEYEYQVQCHKIWRFLSEAIKEGIIRYQSKFSHEEINELENCIVEPDPLTRDAIENVITKAEDIFVAHEIYPA